VFTRYLTVNNALHLILPAMRYLPAPSSWGDGQVTESRGLGSISRRLLAINPLYTQNPPLFRCQSVSDTWSLAKVVGKVELKLLPTTEFSRTPRKRQTNELTYLFFNILSQTIIFQNLSHFQSNI
jgi:hypothetical protein